MKPIPLCLLPDTIRVQKALEADYRGEFGKAKTVRNVRFESAENLVNNSYIFSDGSNGLIYIDAVNSEGAFAIPVGSKVTLKGQTCFVVKCVPVEGVFGRVHHYEVEVR